MQTKKILGAVLFAAIAAGPALAGSKAKNTTANAAVKGENATNTAINKRDEANTTMTPVDQALGSEADIEVTRRIREQLVADAALSTNAKNVKIITTQGVTVLRGPVDSEAEKTKVAGIARQISGSRTVRNELDVVSVGKY